MDGIRLTAAAVTANIEGAVENGAVKGSLENRVSPMTHGVINGTSSAFEAALMQLQSNWGLESLSDVPDIKKEDAAVPAAKKEKGASQRKCSGYSGAKQRKLSVGMRMRAFEKSLNTFTNNAILEEVQNHNPLIGDFESNLLLLKANFTVKISDFYDDGMQNFNSRQRKEIETIGHQLRCVDIFYSELREKFIDARERYINDKTEFEQVDRFVDDELEGAPLEVVQKFKDRVLFDLSIQYVLGRISYHNFLKKIEIKAFHKMLELSVLKEAVGSALMYDPAEKKVEVHLSEAVEAFQIRVSSLYEDHYAELSPDLKGVEAEQRIREVVVERYEIALHELLNNKSIEFKQMKIAFLEKNISILECADEVVCHLDDIEKTKLLEDVLGPLIRDHLLKKISIEELKESYLTAAENMKEGSSTERLKNKFNTSLKKMVQSAALAVSENTSVSERIDCDEIIRDQFEAILNSTDPTFIERLSILGLPWKETAKSYFESTLTCEMKDRRLKFLEANEEWKDVKSEVLKGHSGLQEKYLQDGAMEMLSESFVCGNFSLSDLFAVARGLGKAFYAKDIEKFGRDLERNVLENVKQISMRYTPSRSNVHSFMSLRLRVAGRRFLSKIREEKAKLPVKTRQRLETESYKDACVDLFNIKLTEAIKAKRIDFLRDSIVEATLKREIERIPLDLQLKLIEKFHSLAAKEFISGNLSYPDFLEKFRNVVKTLRKYASIRGR